VASPKSFLIIQTAFIGDVILATAIAEKLHQYYPESPIDFLLRKGNEDLLKNHPFIREVIIWEKKRKKLANLWRIIRRIRSGHYTDVINVHRFMSSGLMTVFSKGRTTIGFDKNPLALFFDEKIEHVIEEGMHETQRNQALIKRLTDDIPARPKLYPSQQDDLAVTQLQKPGGNLPYVCLAPASVWFTKQYPKEKWIEMIHEIGKRFSLLFLIGAPGDFPMCEEIRTASEDKRVVNLAGRLTYLESASLMRKAFMNFVNDSAPMHLASAVNAPVTAIYCSTIPGFGFGPLSDKKFIIETKQALNCRPCGLHGFKSCPEKHFHCATTIQTEQFNEALMSD
jgi:heptosyltransferase II